MDFQALGSRAIAGDAHYFDDSTSPAKVRQYLESNKEIEKLKGMKWLLAMLSKGRDVSEFFPDVVKNVVVKSIEVKKMIYNYLVHYADYDSSCREIALLSINSFQKDMSGSNQLIRGLALRVLTSIRVSDIIQIQLLAVRKCATDSSPYVRKCAATACTKIFALDSDQLPQLQQILDKLLKDSSTMVLGSAIAAFNEICPNNYALIHRSYRKICHLLADMDEWSQISCLEVLTRYVRDQFTDPAPGATAAARLQSKQRSSSALKGKLGTTVKRRIVRKAFYSDEEDEEDEEEVAIEQVAIPERGSIFSALNDIEGDLDPDHRLVLRSAFPLLKSRNSGVVLGVCGLHYYCSAQGDRNNQQVGKSLVRILRNHREIQYVVLTSIHTMARDRPAIFRPFLSEFFVKSSDPVFNRLLKLDILTSICFKDNVIPILKELQVYIKDSNQNLSLATIKAVGRVVDCDPDVAGICMEGLMHLLLCSKSDEVIGETVTVLRQLIQQNTSCEKTPKVMFQLAKLLIDSENNNYITTPIARASIVWLIGEFYEAIGKVSPDILRILAQGYTDEATETKTQILNFAIKLSLRFPDDEIIQNLMTYVLEMARYDVDTDLRDRSRLMTAFMGLAPSNDTEGENTSTVDEVALEELASHAKEIMLAAKLPPVTLLGYVDVDGLPNFTVGSLSSLVGHYVTGYTPIAPWPAIQPDPNVRDALRLGQNGEEEMTSGGGGSSSSHHHKNGSHGNISNKNPSGMKSGKTGNLGDFYKDEDGSEDSGSNEDDEDEDDDSSDNSDDSNDESEENDDDDDESEEEDDESDSDESSEHESEESGDESGSGSDSSSEEELISRIPINLQTKTASIIRQGVRKVGESNMNSAAKSKKDIFNNDASNVNLLTTDFGNSVTLQPTNTFSTNTNIPASATSNETFDSLLGLGLGMGSTGNTPNTKVKGGSNSSSNSNSNSNNDSYSFDGLSGFSMPMIATQKPAATVNLDPFSPENLGFSPSMTMNSGNSSDNNNSLSISGNVTLTDPKVILKPEIGGGLSVAIIYQYGSAPTAIPNAIVGILCLKNIKDHPLRRIGISFAADVKWTSIPMIPQLQPGEEIKQSIEILLQGYAGKVVRADVRTDVGAFVGSLVVDAIDLISPLVISPKDFESYRSSLKGIHESERSYTLLSLGLRPSTGLENEVLKIIKKIMNIYLVQGAGIGEMYTAGLLRKGNSEDKVLVTITSNLDGISIRCNCDDALMSSSLINSITKAFTSRS